jgi:ABC-type amino acid transport substrate-binding protein
MNGWRRVLACAALLLLTKGAGAVGGDWRLATLELPPSIASSLPNQGYYAVLLRRVLAEFGAQPQFVFLPAQRAYQDTASGGYDAAFPYKRTPEREQLFLFSEPFYVARVRVFLNADRRWQPETVAELRGRRGCTLIGAQSPDLLQRDIDQGLVPMQRVSLIEACFRMLQLGRVDFAVAGQNTGWAAVRQLAAQGKGDRGDVLGRGAAAAAGDVEEAAARELLHQRGGDRRRLVEAGLAHRVGQAGVGVAADEGVGGHLASSSM